MTQPRVLVTMNATEPGDLAHQVRERHLRMLAAAGLIPILLPGTLPDQTVVELLDLADAVYLPGGDYVPLRQDEEAPLSATHAREIGLEWDPHKVAIDLAILDAAWERKLPTVGVCGGMQAMAINAGGTLRFATTAELERHADDVEPEPAPVEPGTLAEQIFGPTARVNHFHREVVEDAGDLTVSVRSGDGVVEAVEAPPGASHPLWLGLQWHPEHLSDEAPYRALAAAAHRSFSNQ